LYTVTQVLGNATDPEIAHRLHHLAHEGQVQYISLSKQDISRHRLRVVTDGGTEVAIALARSEQLAHGAVLLLEAERAIVVRVHEQSWLALKPRDAAAAIELGYFAGNMHWKVRFESDVLRIALDGPEENYLARLRHLIAEGKASRVDA
jgi:urease accessory protein